ncbi:hypothetical protein NDU88_003337 [Pleurodeles waltl]|uniref:Uncharacterized protein n=1 Tax=Pleurodeles waltl TaxID=8319 RepID=A0AAV7NGJ6_PLEWA|nr:hypothetical protein NDU88_003337 [Pleurodeles waltl]
MKVKLKLSKPPPQELSEALHALPKAPDASIALPHLGATLHAHSNQFEKILQAILDAKTSYENKIDLVSQDVTLLRADHRELTDRVKETKSSFSTMRPTVRELQTLMKQLSAEVATMHFRKETTQYSVNAFVVLRDQHESDSGSDAGPQQT